EKKPVDKPTKPAATSARSLNGTCCGIVNNGPSPSKCTLIRAAQELAIATGTRLRGFHSNKRSSTARKTAAIGVANTADIPAAAPATKRLFLSAEVRLRNCANKDPTAPPVMMIGPSAPKGPPEPIE